MRRSFRGALAARFQLRLRVLAGVAAVTLVVLAAFDLAAVATMRHYLYGQTRSQLGAELEQTHEELAATTSADSAAYPGTGLGGLLDDVAGAYDLIWLPAHGKPLVMEIDTTSVEELRYAATPVVTRTITRAMTRPGFRTVSIAGHPVLLEGIDVPGGLIVAGTGLAPVTGTVTRIERIVLAGSAAVVVLIVAGVFLVLRRGLRPIESMAAQAGRITAGDLTNRVASRDPRSEVGQLGAALNGMLTRIEATMREREAGQEQMRRFFADASHELRTPLASLLANAELHQHGALTEPAQITEVMRRMAVETQRMGRLVDDMLHLARLGQRPGQSREPVDLTALVTGCAGRARAAGPGRTWRVDVTTGLTVTGDAELLRRAVGNLCTNVLVHTPPDGTARIAATAADGQIRVEVSDDGPGVPPDRLPHVFERFYRAGAGTSRPGSGLGLAIVAEVAAAHGGSAEAAPVTPHGLRVTMTLPAGRADPGGSCLDQQAVFR